ncbi:PriCT-2 domain-containing protein, partial [Acinetobacter baumannii]
MWLKAGMALHHEFDGSSDALALWDEWSQGSCKYAGYDVCQEKWSTFGNNGHNPVTARWLLKYGGEA